MALHFCLKSPASNTVLRRSVFQKSSRSRSIGVLKTISSSKPDNSRKRNARLNSSNTNYGENAVSPEVIEMSSSPTLDDEVDEDGFLGPEEFIDRDARGSELVDGMSLRELQRQLLKISRVLPRRIILVRHGESEGNIDETMYSRVPDPRIRLTQLGKQQASNAGLKLKSLFEQDNSYQVFFYLSPYRRSQQTCLEIARVFPRDRVVALREEVQLREQDFGNFQDVQKKTIEKEERIRYGRFYYRFPHGESGADVNDRVTIFQDHLVRDIDKGNFDDDCNIVLVTHGLTLRIFLARWFHWTISELEEVYNPPNSCPIILERVAAHEGIADSCRLDGECDPESDFHTKELYSLTAESIDLLKGCTPAMGNKTNAFDSWKRTLSFDEFEGDEEFYEVEELETVDEGAFDRTSESVDWPGLDWTVCESAGCERDRL